MSLRAFHIFFIVTALGFLTFLAYWFGTQTIGGQNSQNLALAVSALVGIAMGIPYLTWFIRKNKALN